MTDTNTGNMNSGHWNPGNRNSGDWNPGDWNSGNWNSCDYETGYFNTEQSCTMRVFNKPCDRDVWEEAEKPYILYFSHTIWVPETEMTDQEKTDNDTFHTTGGYLKSIPYKEAFQASWDEATEEDRDKVRSLPNFDAEVFFEISGIKVDAPCCPETIIVDGVTYVRAVK